MAEVLCALRYPVNDTGVALDAALAAALAKYVTRLAEHGTADSGR